MAVGLGAPGALTQAAAPAKPRLHWHAHFAFANRYIKHRAGAISYGVVGPNGFYHGRHGGRTVPMASTFKVMLLVSLLRKRADHPLSRRDRRLLAPMIRRSDNVAATEVRDMVGARRIRRLARVAGMRDFHYNPIWGLSRSSPRDQVRFMYHLQRYVPGRHRAFARYLLSHVIRSQRWGIGRVAPPGWKLFLKGGWGSGTGLVDHQVALLKRGHRRISLAIFTQFDPDHAYGKRTLLGVASRLLRGL